MSDLEKRTHDSAKKCRCVHAILIHGPRGCEYTGCGCPARGEFFQSPFGPGLAPEPKTHDTEISVSSTATPPKGEDGLEDDYHEYKCIKHGDKCDLNIQAFIAHVDAKARKEELELFRKYCRTIKSAHSYFKQEATYELDERIERLTAQEQRKEE